MENQQHDLLKKKEDKNIQQKENKHSGVSSFTPPPSGIDPVPIQHKKNIIQEMQDLPKDERPEYFKPNIIQQIQRKKSEQESKQFIPSGEKKMPDDVQAKMENSFGADFSDVRIFEGSNASNINALAYTQGNEIHFAPGKFQPTTHSGQELIGHELTHVLQQRSDKVSETTQTKGLPLNDDPSLEQEADEMGRLAAQGKVVQGKFGEEEHFSGVMQMNEDTQSTAISLSSEEVTKAKKANEFILNETKSIKIIQSQLEISESDEFSNETINAIANWQNGKSEIIRKDGILDYNTLDVLVKELTNTEKYEDVLEIVFDFYNINEHLGGYNFEYDESLNEPFKVETNNTIKFGKISFNDGLSEISKTIEQAIGEEALISEKILNTFLSESNSDRQNSLWDNPNTNQETGAIPWIREKFPDETDISEYLQRTDITSDNKIETLGQLSVELGRIEFLMGVLFHGGNNQSWETLGSNKGPFLNYYKSKVGNNPNGNPWCTMFSGYLKRMIGFSNQLSNQGPLIFNSGSRLDWWGTAGTNLLTGQDDFSDPSDFQNYSGSNIDTPAWISLRNDLNVINLTEEQKRDKVNNFLASRITPQPGDILVVNDTTNNTYGEGLSSHTTTVESYSDCKIKTIEGNKGNKVTGTTINLTDINHVRKILLLIRIGTEFFPDSTNDSSNTVENNISKEDLLNPLKFITRNLQILAHNKNYISSGTNNALVQDMAGANNNGGTQ